MPGTGLFRWRRSAPARPPAPQLDKKEKLLTCFSTQYSGDGYSASPQGNPCLFTTQQSRPFPCREARPLILLAWFQNRLLACNPRGWGRPEEKSSPISRTSQICTGQKRALTRRRERCRRQLVHAASRHSAPGKHTLSPPLIRELCASNPETRGCGRAARL